MSHFKSLVEKYLEKDGAELIRCRRRFIQMRKDARSLGRLRTEDEKILARDMNLQLDAIRVAALMQNYKCESIGEKITKVNPEAGTVDWNQPNIDERLKDGKFLDKPESKIGHVPELKRCDCGAKHTAFPNHHSNWCSAKEW